MSATTVSQFAVELKMPVAALLEQLSKAGVGKGDASDTLTDQDKTRLLDYLRRAHGDESKAKITLTRKQTSEIKATDAHGRARTVQVEVRKKRVLVKRDDIGEHGTETELEAAAEHEAPAPESIPEPVVEIVPEPVVEVIPEPVVEEVPAPVEGCAG
jgi:translation initiation factor IF-2